MSYLKKLFGVDAGGIASERRKTVFLEPQLPDSGRRKEEKLLG